MTGEDEIVTAQAKLKDLLTRTLVAGYHGEASLHVTVQDGHIQYLTTQQEEKHRLTKK